jgi:hypothetical protein
MIANPVNGVLTPHEVGYILADSGAAALVSTKALADGLAGVLAPPPLLAPGRPPLAARPSPPAARPSPPRISPLAARPLPLAAAKPRSRSPSRPSDPYRPKRLPQSHPASRLPPSLRHGCPNHAARAA